MDAVLILPSLLQGLAIMVDEFYFHKERGLGRWERVGHPVDTSTVIACYAIVLGMSFTRGHLIFFAVVAAISCLTVTKDEFVHQEQCTGAENWLHSVLFVLHPLVLIAAGVSWYMAATPSSSWWAEMLILTPADLRLALWGQAAIISGFFLYQTFYWNVLCKSPPVERRSITRSTTPSVSVGTAPSMTP